MEQIDMAKLKQEFDAFWSKEIDTLALNKDIKGAFYFAWITGYLAGMERCGNEMERMETREAQLIACCKDFKTIAENAIKSAKETTEEAKITIALERQVMGKVG